jgi:two-component system response regulator NreC
MKFRVALIDDHPIFRQGLKALISEQLDMEVIGEAVDARGAHSIAETMKPDVLVMDMSLQDGDGISAGQDISRAWPGIRMLGLSMHTSEFFVARALNAGFQGYAFKSQPPDQITQALHRVADGKFYVPDEFAHLLATAGSPAPAPRGDGQQAFSDLSRREREVFDLILRGYTNQRIARTLFISIKTVETHRSHINRKLHVHSTGELIRMSALSGLLAS